MKNFLPPQGRGRTRKKRLAYQVIDHAKEEKILPSQDWFITALIHRLTAEQIYAPVFVNCHFAIVRHSNGTISIRAADCFLQKYGLVIEVDGNAHDRLSKRIQRDLTREADWNRVGCVVMRISSEDVFDPAKLNRFLNEVIGYIRNLEASGDLKGLRRSIRQRISRFNMALLKAAPDHRLNAQAWPQLNNSRKGVPSAPYRNGYVIFPPRLGAILSPNPQSQPTANNTLKRHQ